MSGIYIHIPYCKKACIYCDFHFSTQIQTKDDFLNALVREIELTAGYLPDSVLKTIYFGGGTPSVLSYSEWMYIFEALSKYYDLSQLQEVTLEANPDDLTPSKIQEIINTPINRLSIGVQSFHEEHLQWMNRSHNLGQVHASLRYLQDQSFHNLSIDLIYGFPQLSEGQWEENLRQATEVYQIPHVSAYFLTVEPKTMLYHQVQKKAVNMEEYQGEQHYQQLCAVLKAQGYEHYETSNFAKLGFRAKHNSSYWNGAPYLGLGPSAHSFNGHERSYNVSNNPQYIKALLQEEHLPHRVEHLQVFEQFNDFLITRLRTKEGIQKSEVELHFLPRYWQHIAETMAVFQDPKLNFQFNEEGLRILEESWIYQDALLRELVLLEDLG